MSKITEMSGYSEHELAPIMDRLSEIIRFVDYDIFPFGSDNYAWRIFCQKSCFEVSFDILILPKPDQENSKPIP